MKKIISLGVILGMSMVMMTACGNNNTENIVPTETKAPVETVTEQVDAVTTASIVNKEDAFLNGISKNGTWIIATLKDLTFDKELILEGEFTNKDLPARKIALYEQDAEHNITASYTLTAPKLTVKSENARIQGGTFVGDVYVEANGFQVVKGKVEGNIYFANEEFKASFDASDNGVVTGVTEVK